MNPAGGASDNEPLGTGDRAQDDAQLGEGLDRRLAFLALTEEDQRRLGTLVADFLSQQDEFVERFYTHLFAHEQTRKFLRDPILVARLKETQKAHLRSLLAADWDDDFASQRRLVGEAHANIGVEPELFLGAYNIYLQHWITRLFPEDGPTITGLTDVERVEALRSLARAVFLDVGLTLDAYFQRLTQNIRKALNLYWNANVELRQFAQLASHDLKTPLATVANLCDEALDEFRGQMPPGACQLIEQAQKRVYRMCSTIDELLAATVAEQDTFRTEEVDSSSVLREAIEELRPALKEKGIRLALSGEFPLVPADRARLREVFHNLLSNAVKFLDKVPGQIDISVRHAEEEWIFSIKDNGPGIPPHEQERIFSPFRRVPQQRDVPGSGLGLYFTRNLVHQLRGRVWVESVLGRGSEFFVALKRHPDDVPVNGKE